MSEQRPSNEQTSEPEPTTKGVEIDRRTFVRKSVGVGVAATIGGLIVGGGALALRAWHDRSFQRGVSLAGAEFGPEQLPGVHGVDYFYPTVDSLDYYLARGLTLIRLPCRWERLQHVLNGELDPDELGRLDALVAGVRIRKMQLIIDIHNYARYQGGLIGTIAVPTSAFSDFWRRLAGHFRDESAIWAYGLMNEPHNTGGRWPAAAQAGVDGIRATDLDRPILVSGDNWSSAVSWREANETLYIVDRSDKIIYEAHQYFDADNAGHYLQTYDVQHAYPNIGIDRIRPFVEWLHDHRVRGFIGEYGVPGGDPRWLVALDRFLAHLDDQRIGAACWAGGAHWGDYPLSLAPLNGGDRPQMAILQRHLAR